MNVTIFIVIYGKEMVSLESQSISDFYFKKEIFQFLVSLEDRGIRTEIVFGTTFNFDFEPIYQTFHKKRKVIIGRFRFFF